MLELLHHVFIKSFSINRESKLNTPHNASSIRGQNIHLIPIKHPTSRRKFKRISTIRSESISNLHSFGVIDFASILRKAYCRKDSVKHDFKYSFKN
uniref:Ovule protein n=1 Tax=Strongyloides venezuelensis TaxID=75913 RepID=A0A0K0G576_STRVS